MVLGPADPVDEQYGDPSADGNPAEVTTTETPGDDQATGMVKSVFGWAKDNIDLLASVASVVGVVYALFRGQ